MMARTLRILSPILMLALLGTASARWDDDTGDELPPEPAGKVAPVLNIGGHSGRISEMVFSKDNEYLYTVGMPGEVHEWDTTTGEQLRVWRFPTPMTRIAAHADGLRLAVSGVSSNNKKGRVPVWLIHLENGKATLNHHVEGKTAHRLSFTQNKGQKVRLAVSAGTKTTVFPYSKNAKYVALTAPTGQVASQEFNKGGRWMVTARANFEDKKAPPVRIFDLDDPQQKIEYVLDQSGRVEPRATWSRFGPHVVTISGGPSPTLQFYTFDQSAFQMNKSNKGFKSPDWGLDDAQLREQLKIKGKKDDPWYSIGVAFRSANEVIACWEQNNLVRIASIDVNTKKAKLLPGTIQRNSHFGGMALSDNGRWLAVGTQPAFKVALYDLDKQRQMTYTDVAGEQRNLRIGPELTRPNSVGWMPNGYGIVWNQASQKAAKKDKEKKNPAKKAATTLTHGLDLVKLQTIAPGDRQRSSGGRLEEGWKVEVDPDSHKAKLIRPAPPTKKAKKTPPPITTPLTFKEVQPALTRMFRADKQPRLLVVHDGGRRLSIVHPETGKEIAPVGESFYPVYDLAVSPDDKYLLVANGGPALQIYDLARPADPILQVLAGRNDWIAWHGSGYYAGTPGGEQLIGWKVTTEENRLARFYPAQTFRRRLYQPEVIKALLPGGSLAVALKALPKQEKARAVESIDDALPPEVTITKVEPKDKGKTRWLVNVEVKPQKKQSVDQLRLMVDDCALDDELGTRDLKGATKATFEVPADKLPSGKIELKVLARSADVYGVSPPHEFEARKQVKEQPTLYVVSVGLNYTNDPDLKLRLPEKDAKDVAEQFPASCAGPTNLFKHDAKQHRFLLLDEKATEKAIVDTLMKIRKDVKAHDRVVFFFAGHGVCENGQLYLLTHGYDLKNLKGTALSGEKLRSVFGRFRCHVLMLLDACHSGAAAKSLRDFTPPSDDALRQQSDEDCSVWLLAAAQGNEKAQERAGDQNGLFTGALIKALTKDQDLPYDKRDGRQYVNHLYVEIHDEVRYRSKDRQHPTQSPPWTISAFAVRQVKK